jgi:hypothetical protein
MAQPSGQSSPFPATSGARATGAKRVSNMTDEQKGVAAERMALCPDFDVVRPANCFQAIGPLSQLVARSRPQAWRVGAKHRDDRF